MSSQAVAKFDKVEPAVARRAIPAKVQALASKAVYAAPKIISFPVNGLRPSEVLTMAGNTGGP